MKHLEKLMILMALVFVSSCASILSGTKQIVSVNSNIQGANVYIDGVMVGQTPYNAQIKKKSSTNIRVEKKGFNSKTMVMTTSLPTAFWGNIISGGFLGSTTDFASGAAYEYSPNNYFFHLYNEDLSEEEALKTQVEKRATKFILVNHQNLMHEIAKGEGEFLDSLVKLLDSEMKGHELALKLRDLNFSRLTAPQMASVIRNL